MNNNTCIICKGTGVIYGLINGDYATEPCASCKGTGVSISFPPSPGHIANTGKMIDEAPDTEEDTFYSVAEHAINWAYEMLVTHSQDDSFAYLKSHYLGQYADPTKETPLLDQSKEIVRLKSLIKMYEWFIQKRGKDIEAKDTQISELRQSCILYHTEREELKEQIEKLKNK